MMNEMSQKSILLMRDFNFPDVDWENLSTDKIGEGFVESIQK